jgi:hypothetical protein
MQDEKRTVRDYVEDMLSDGKTKERILIVAQNTHWQTNIEEIKEILKEF